MPAGTERVGDFVHRLLKIRIELLAGGIEFLDAVFLQRVEQRPLGQLDAFDQGFQDRIGQFPGLGRDRIERTLQIVGDVEHVAGESGDAVDSRIGNLFRGPLAQVFHFRKRPQHLVT